MSQVAVISSWYGAHQDRVGPQPDQTVDADWIMVTDQPVADDRWTVVHEPRPELGSRMAAKLAKFRPQLYAPEATTTIWLDAAARFVDQDGIARLLDWAGGAPIAQFPHPARSCLFDEADVSANVWKYRHQNLAGQVDHYRRCGMPAGWGLWATGVIVRHHPGPHDSELACRVGDAWLLEQFRWTDQDQVSEPFVLWRHGTRPHALPHGVFDNPAVSWDYTGRRW